jgi:hypothetical protein
VIILRRTLIVVVGSEPVSRFVVVLLLFGVIPRPVRAGNCVAAVALHAESRTQMGWRRLVNPSWCQKLGKWSTSSSHSRSFLLFGGWFAHNFQSWRKKTHTSRSARHRLSHSFHQPPYHCYHEILQHDLLCHPRILLCHCSGCPAARWRWRRRRRRRHRRRCTAATPTRTEDACPAQQFLHCV